MVVPHKKQDAQAYNDGEDYGLVPARFLKRKLSNDDDTLLSSEFLKDTHVDVVKKSPKEIATQLQKLDAILTRQYYAVATLVDSPYVQNWKETMLRAEGFQLQPAADRMESRWKTKLDLFGANMIHKKITSGDVPGVEGGYVQLLPTRDLAGRAILFFKFCPNMYSKQEKEFRKYLYYMISSALEDEETQSKGIVLVVLNHSPTWFLDSFWRAWRDIRVPFRISRLHYCAISPDSSYSCRESEEHSTVVRVHQGSHQECLHALMFYGVPGHLLPITHDGNLERERHNKWIELRRRTDSFQHQKWSIVLVPNREDVLFGRRNQSSPGNVRYHGLLVSHLAEYHDATDADKKALIKHIWTSIIAKGGRFLQQIEGGCVWEQMEEVVSLSKIGQALKFLCHQVYESANNDRRLQDVAHYLDFGDFFLSKECCNLMHSCDRNNQCISNISCWQPTPQGKGLV